MCLALSALKPGMFRRKDSLFSAVMKNLEVGGWKLTVVTVHKGCHLVCACFCVLHVRERDVLTGMVWLPWRALIADWASVCVENLTKAQPGRKNRHRHTHTVKSNQSCDVKSLWYINKGSWIIFDVAEITAVRGSPCTAGCSAPSIRQADKQAKAAGYRLHWWSRKTCYLAPHACLCILNTN